MANGVEQVADMPRLGPAVAVVIGALVALPIAVVWLHAGSGGAFGQQDWTALRFTVTQAAASAAISVALAVPLARALWRRRFPGRRLLILLMGAPFILPVIVAVFGLLAVFGRSGMMNGLLGLLGVKPVSVYGFWGVVLAHVFFNLPFVTRLVLQGWAAIPVERFRLAASLGMRARAVGRFLERPMLREVLPGAGLAVFLICMTSFAVALTMGGGPKATTIELAIYQAFRFDFDLGRAASLAAVQVVLCMSVAAVTLRFAVQAGFGAGFDRGPFVVEAGSLAQRLSDSVLIVLAALFLILPIGVVVADGLPQVPGLPVAVWAAAGRSVVVAGVATILCLFAALPLALALPGRRWGRLIETMGMLPMASSSVVFGTGVFLMLRGVVSPAALALPVTALANALAALPFALRVIAPGARQVAVDYGRLADSLGIHGWQRLRLVTLPRLRRPLGFAAGLAAAMSMGDLGVVALFADPNAATLPLTMYQLMGAYRMDAAAGAAVLLLGLSLTAFWLCEVWGHRDTDA